MDNPPETPETPAAPKEKKSSLLKESTSYAVGNLVVAVMPVLLLPYLARGLTVVEYGIVGSFQMVLGLATSTIGLNSHAAVARQWFKTDGPGMRRYIGTAIWLLCGAGLLFLLLGFLCGGFIEAYLGLPRWVFPMLVACAIGQHINQMALAIWQVSRKPFIYVGMAFLQAFSIAVATVIMVESGFGWQGRIYGQLAGAIVSGLAAYITLSLRPGIDLRFDRHEAKHIFGFGGPLVLHGLGKWGFSMGGRAIVIAVAGLGAGGLFTAGTQVASLFRIFIEGASKAWGPAVYHALSSEKPEARTKLRNALTRQLLILTAICVVGAILTPWAIHVFLGAKYAGSEGVAIVSMFAYLTWAFYTPPSAVVSYFERTKDLASQTLIVSAIGMVVTYFLVKWLGVIGAAYGLLGSYGVQALLTHQLAQRIWHKNSHVPGDNIEFA